MTFPIENNFEIFENFHAILLKIQHSIINLFFENFGSYESLLLFLIFVWGRDTLPAHDEDFRYKFQINTFDVAVNEVDKTLPR